MGVSQEREPKPLAVNNYLKVGNKSKLANNWIGGPTHEVMQQHIPGYKGHVAGVKAENYEMTGGSFARTTAKSFLSKLKNGKRSQDLSPADRFTSVQQKDFSPANFRRFCKLVHHRGKSKIYPKKRLHGLFQDNQR